MDGILDRVGEEASLCRGNISWRTEEVGISEGRALQAEGRPSPKVRGEIEFGKWNPLVDKEW